MSKLLGPAKRPRLLRFLTKSWEPLWIAGSFGLQ